MSILNLAVTPDRVLVTVDTRGVLRPEAGPAAEMRQGAALEAAKVHVLAPHGAVLAGRGTVGYAGLVYLSAVSRCAADFDALADVMPSCLEHADQLTHGLAATRGAAGASFLSHQEVALVGWSARLGRMVALLWVRDEGMSAFERFEVNDSWVVPWADEWGALPEPADASELGRTAIRQMAMLRQHAPDMAPLFGGRLLLAEVTREQVALRTLVGLA